MTLQSFVKIRLLIELQEAIDLLYVRYFRLCILEESFSKSRIQIYLRFYVEIGLNLQTRNIKSMLLFRRR